MMIELNKKVKNSFVYFISECRNHNLKGNSAVKIGVARNPATRLAELQTGNPKELELALTFSPMSEKQAYHLESRFHSKFRKYKIRGEWFRKLLFSELKLIDDVRFTGEVKAYRIRSGEMTRYAREKKLELLEEQDAARVVEMDTLAQAKRRGL